MTTRIQSQSGSWPTIGLFANSSKDALVTTVSSTVTVQLLPSPIGDAISVSRRAARLAADPARAAALANARKWLSEQAPFKNGESLKKLRLGRGMSQSQLATAAKSTQANIARIESGHTDVQLSTIEKLAVALDLDPTRVFNAIRTSRAA